MVEFFSLTEKRLNELDMIKAIYNSDLDGLRKLLEKGVDSNALEENLSKNSALHIAIGLNVSVKFADLLLQYRAKANYVSQNGHPVIFGLTGEGPSDFDLREKLKILIQYGANPNSSLPSGTTILLQIIKRDIDAAKALLRFGANLNKYNESCQNALRVALELGLKENIEHFCQSALHVALELGLKENVELLLEAGADVNAIEFNGKSVLDYAFASGKVVTNAYYDENKKYIKSVSEPDKERDIIIDQILKKDPDLHLVPAGKSKSIIIDLLDRNNNPLIEKFEEILLRKAFAEEPNKSRSDMSLVQAVKLNKDDLAKKFLEHGANPNAKDENGVSILGFVDHKSELFQLLLKSGADPDVTDAGGWPIITRSNAEVTLELLKYGANPNVIHMNSITPLIMSVRSNNLEKIKILLDYNVEVNFTPSNNLNALHAAFNNQNLEIIEYLLEHGANPNITDYEGTAVLMKAISSPEKLELLLKYNVDVNALTDAPKWGFDVSALSTCIKAKAYRSCELLLNNGAKVDIADEKGITSLMKAAFICDHKVVELFLDHHANVSAVDSWGDNALMRAEAKHAMIKYESVSKRIECEKTIHLLKGAIQKSVSTQEEFVEVSVLGEAENNCWYGFSWFCDIVL